MIERVHDENPLTPHGISNLLELMSRNLACHMQEEEHFLFSALQVGKPFAAGPLSVMRSEHADFCVTLSAIAGMTNDMRPPRGACVAWCALYSGLRGLSDDLVENIRLENDILFPRFEL